MFMLLVRSAPGVSRISARLMTVVGVIVSGDGVRAWSLTSTLWDIVPTASWKRSDGASRDVTTTSWVPDWKPLFSTATRYWPTGTPENSKLPSDRVTAVSL